MALMEVIKYGDPILRKKCKTVKNFKELQTLIDDMFDTMYEESGIGLAANQIGVDLNIFIIDISGIEEETESVHIYCTIFCKNSVFIISCLNLSQLITIIFLLQQM